MSLALIDWLYVDDLPSQNKILIQERLIPKQGVVISKQGALIVFPRMIDRWNVASLIVSGWEKYKIIIVTDHPNEFMETIFDTAKFSGDGHFEWTNLELIPFLLLKYSDLNEINDAFNNTEVDIVLFDDVGMLSIISPAIQNIIFSPKILVLTTWGDTMQQFNIVTEKFPDLKLLTLDAISDNASIDWKITRVQMSDRQLKYYDQIRANEIHNAPTINAPTINTPGMNGVAINTTTVNTPTIYTPGMNGVAINTPTIYTPGMNGVAINTTTVNTPENIVSTGNVIPYPLTRMVTLYAYPDNIMADTIAHKYICETDQHSQPDIIITPYNNHEHSGMYPHRPANKSWLNVSHINSICNDGPKLFSVLDGIIANWPAKQIVITRFNHRYGVDLITSFLQLMTQNKQTPYELDEIFHTSCTDEYEMSVNVLHKFNESESGVLITNIIPFVPLKGISVIHIADSYSFLNLQKIINRVHKRHLNISGSDIIIYSHLATHPKEQSSDEALNEKLEAYIRDANRIYAGLISIGTKLSFDASHGLVVQS